ncbi:class I SAM-dependent methyltransferase [Planctobacterium marinum]|uniref:class I SAM-dependent methyltransferase n=1 Tax=Planctobacterium marinum TaxID=1631968 RepID=UPI001E37343C|nr:class I SAM-dependent methyltransferase [Planctobacterium marinum]MCC2608066.1 class I SAM-dependent methyltransferase [Planctobacterium marinum]
MNREEITDLFDQQATIYDDNWQKVKPIKDAMHLVLQAAFRDLPDDARILCVGSGTGQEVVYLAQAFPSFQFTLVEPAPTMMQVCRANLTRLGYASRCEFHVGYLENLSHTPIHHAATSLLVSHFLMDPAARSEFFREIAARLLPGGILFNADLMADTESADYPAVLNLWMSVLHQTGMDAAKKQEIRETYERDVAILPAHKVVSLIEAGGFNKALACYQAGMITAHTAFKS